MKRTLALPLALALLVPGAAAQEKATDAGPGVRAVAPFLGEQTFAVAHVDLSRLDLNALTARLGRLANADPEAVSRFKAEANRRLKTLRDAGIRDLYVVANLEGFPNRPAVLLVVPLAGNADADTVTKALRRVVHEPSARIGDAVVVADQAVLRRLKDRKPAAVPDLGKGFAAAGDGTAQLVLLLPRSLRRALEETLPDLPEELGGGSVRVLTRGFSWAAVGLKLTPPLSWRLTVQARDARAARGLARLYEAGLRHLFQALSKDPDAEALVPRADALRELLTPKVADSRLTLTLTDRQLTSFLGPIAARTRAAAQRARNANNLKELALAMHSYLDTHKTFPAHAAYDQKGRPLLSWRVYLLPYVEHENLFKEFHLDEPWDSEHNKKLIARMPAVFRDPSSKAGPGKTTYVVPVGKDTVFPPGPKGLMMRDIPDGTSNTLLIVEADDAHAVTWTKPDDLRYNPKDPLQALANVGGRFAAAFADGSVRNISRKINPDTLRNLFTRNDGQVIGDIP